MLAKNRANKKAMWFVKNKIVFPKGKRINQSKTAIAKLRKIKFPRIKKPSLPNLAGEFIKQAASFTSKGVPLRGYDLAKSRK